MRPAPLVDPKRLDRYDVFRAVERRQIGCAIRLVPFLAAAPWARDIERELGIPVADVLSADRDMLLHAAIAP